MKKSKEFLQKTVHDHWQLFILLVVAGTAGALMISRIKSSQQSYGLASQASGIPDQAKNVPFHSGQSRGIDRTTVLVKFIPGLAAAKAQETLNTLGLKEQTEITQIGVKVLSLPSNQDPETIVDRLEKNPNVEFAQTNNLVEPSLLPNDPIYPNQTALQKIQINGAWDRTIGSSTVVVAICDTGVNSAHEDLADKTLPGWNVYNNNSDYSDVVGHGTSVAGVAAASTNNGLGVAAAAWAPKILPIRMSQPDGNASSSAAASCLTWAADHGAKIVNMSYNFNFIAKTKGGKTTYAEDRTVSTAAKYVQSKGGIVVMAAGNTGDTATLSDNSYILAVGATDNNDLIESYSVKGNLIDLVAPDHTTAPCYVPSQPNSYCGTGGTSFAAPQVAGVAALIFSVKPAITPTQIQNLLKQNADDLGSAGFDSTYGAGRLNASRAVNASCSLSGAICN